MDYYLIRHDANSSPARHASKLKRVEVRCKLQCWTQKFRQIGFDPALPTLLLAGPVEPISIQFANLSLIQQYQCTPFDLTLRGPPTAAQPLL